MNAMKRILVVLLAMILGNGFLKAEDIDYSALPDSIWGLEIDRVQDTIFLSVYTDMEELSDSLGVWVEANTHDLASIWGGESRDFRIYPYLVGKNGEDLLDYEYYLEQISDGVSKFYVKLVLYPSSSWTLKTITIFLQVRYHNDFHYSNEIVGTYTPQEQASLDSPTNAENGYANEYIDLSGYRCTLNSENKVLICNTFDKNGKLVKTTKVINLN